MNDKLCRTDRQKPPHHSFCVGCFGNEQTKGSRHPGGQSSVGQCRMAEVPLKWKIRLEGNSAHVYIDAKVYVVLHIIAKFHVVT